MCHHHYQFRASIFNIRKLLSFSLCIFYCIKMSTIKKLSRTPQRFSWAHLLKKNLYKRPHQEIAMNTLFQYKRCVGSVNVTYLNIEGTTNKNISLFHTLLWFLEIDIEKCYTSSLVYKSITLIRSCRAKILVKLASSHEYDEQKLVGI